MIRQELLKGLILRGLPIPVDPWLHAVAGEVAVGHVYVVATDLDMSEFDRDVSEPPPSSLT